MWRADTGWYLVVGAHRVECAELPRGAHGPAARSAMLPIEPADGESPDAAMRRIVAAVCAAALAGAEVSTGSRTRLSVLVSDRWIALTTIAWGQALPSTATRERFVRGQLEAAGFTTAPTDVVRIDDGPGFGQPRIAAAYPGALLALLGDAASALGARLESVQPLEAALTRLARQRVGRSLQALALLDGARLRFMATGPDGVTAGQSLEDPALSIDPTSTLLTLWRRQQLRDPALGDAEALHLLDLRDPARRDRAASGPGPTAVTWRDDDDPPRTPALRAALVADPGATLNAARPTRRAGPLAWGVAAVSLALSAVLVLQASRFGESAKTSELLAAGQTVRPAATAAPAWTREELARIRAVNAAIREINLPIATLLRALQPPRDIRVALLGIAVEPAGAANDAADGFATLKLSAESASGAEMARYVGHLAGRAPLQRAYLVSHSVDETDTAYPYRFTVELTWRE